MSERTHIEVESELNPRYLELGSTIDDYYGIYHVVEYRDGVPVILATFDDPFTDRRGDAYRYAGAMLNPPRKETT